MTPMSSQHYAEDASAKVSPKVTAGGVATALTMVVLWLIGQIPLVATWPASVTTPLFGLITAAVGALCAYAVPDAARYVENHIPAGIEELLDVGNFDIDAWLEELAEKITHEVGSQKAELADVPAEPCAKLPPSTA